VKSHERQVSADAVRRRSRLGVERLRQAPHDRSHDAARRAPCPTAPPAPAPGPRSRPNIRASGGVPKAADEEIRDPHAELRVVDRARKRKAENTSQTVVLLNPERAFSGESVPVSSRIVAATNTLTPIATGRVMSAMIVAANTANKCCCVGLKPGSGQKYRKKPGTSTKAQAARGESGGRDHQNQRLARECAGKGQAERWPAARGWQGRCAAHEQGLEMWVGLPSPRLELSPRFQPVPRTESLWGEGHPTHTSKSEERHLTDVSTTGRRNSFRRCRWSHTWPVRFVDGHIPRGLVRCDAAQRLERSR